MPECTGTEAALPRTPGDTADDTAPELDGEAFFAPLQRRWSAIGTAVAVGCFWMLATLGRPWQLFTAPRVATADFFDTQATSLLHGRLSVPPGSLGIEEFITPHGSHMYFGIFPAVLRLPIRVFTGPLRGQLSVVSCLLAVALIAWSAARLARRAELRLFAVPSAPLAPSHRWYALIAAAPVIFSPVMYLAARSMVYYEAIAWGCAGALWGIDRAMQWWGTRCRRDAWWMVLAATVAVNSRPSVGLAPLLMLSAFAAALAVRRSWRHAAVAGSAVFAAFAVYATVNYGRFRQLWGAPAHAQRAYEVLPGELRAAAALTDDSLFSLRYVPTTFARYFNLIPGFMRPTRLFPFVEFVDRPTAVGHAPMQLEYSGSLITTAPVLALLAMAGLVWIVRRGNLEWRVAAGACAAASATTLGFWAVWHRYLVDFVPMLVVMALPGFWWLLRAMRPAPRWGRRLLVVGVASLLLVGMVGEVGLALWTRFFYLVPNRTEEISALSFRYRLDDALFGGRPPGVHVVRADTPRDALPPVRSGDVLIAGDCDGMYFGGSGWQAITLRSGGDRRAVLVASPEQLAALTTGTHVLASGDGWRLETRPFMDPTVLATLYIDTSGKEIFGAISLTRGPVVLDVIADPVEQHVSVFQADMQVLDLYGVAAGGMQIGPGWTTLPGGSELCNSLFRRAVG